MIDLLVLGAGVSAVSLVAYKYGKMRTKTADGCNGHHWGEPYRPDDDGVSHAECERAGLPKEVQHKSSEHLEAEVLSGTVVLRGKAIKECQDCGERKVVDITVGSVPVSAFEDSQQVS